MKSKILGKKSVALWLVVLITLGLFLPNTVSASPKIYEDDGIWIDTFEDTSGFKELDDVELSNGTLKARKGFSTKRTFDFSEFFTGHRAYHTGLIPLLSGREGRTPFFIPMLRRLFLETELDSRNETGLKKPDDDVFSMTNPFQLARFSAFTVAQHFSFELADKPGLLNSIEILWRGKATNASKIELYVWKHIQNILGIPQLGSWKRAVVNSSPAVNLQNMTINISKGVPDYASGQVVDFFVIVTPESMEACKLYTDYVKVTTYGQPNYVERGNATSIPISPEDIDPSLSNWRWENIIWDGVGFQDVATIKIQVLDSSNLKAINDSILEGNSKGFRSSPIDISSIPTAIHNNITLRGLFYTDDITMSARLYDWVVTWQREDTKYSDKFSTDLRVDRGTGVDFEDGKIRISAYASDWPVFGNTLDNNRLYEGPGPKKYRFSGSTEHGLGGVFCSPVFSNGKVYVASDRYDRIFAIDTSDQKEVIIPVDESPLLDYPVEMAPAVVDDVVIIATCGSNKENKIYAFNKTNLSEEKWNHSGEGKIGYSASPTGHDGKVFITSWSGSGWDTPLLTSFINKLPSFLGITGGNNKIISLDTWTGDVLWSRGLPAGSFSTPAVHDHMVFVGCENMDGNSLFAFDEDTGTLLWNATVGLIGRSSPVVYNGKVFVLVKEKVQTLKWITKIIAVDEYTGELKWNKTIGENVTAWQNVPKDFFAFLEERGFAGGVQYLKMYNLMSATTPAVYNGVVFPISSDGILYALNADTGDEIWKAELDSGTFNVPIYTIASPIFADGLIYTITWDGTIIAFNEKGEIVWSDLVGEAYLTYYAVVSSPIIADGFLYINTIDNTLDWSMFRIGEFTFNTKASVVSNPISIPKSRWWDKFYGSYDNSSGGNVTFSILREDYTVLKGNLNGTGKDKTGNDISDFATINTNTIRLAAYFTRELETHDPFLETWYVTWKPEITIPAFYDTSFKPDPTGWINTNTPTCSVSVYDLIPGLDVGSAKYGITYVSISDKGKVKTKWYNANSTGEYGTRDNVTITAKISDADVSDDIFDLKEITISIHDLAGNNATITKTFRKDTVIPTSSIKNVTDFVSSYNKPVVIKADASDPGDPDVNKSGVKNVVLYYRLKGAGDWLNYGESTAYNWTFQNDTSGEYEFYTIASDNAGNREEDKDQAELSFIFDIHKPYKPVYEGGYTFYSLPEFSVVFEDDFELESVYYRLNFYGANVWTKIADNINSKSYTGRWTLTQDDWDYMEDEETATEEEYYLYFKLIDSAGNEYITPEAEGLKIVKSLTEFTYYLDLSDFSEWHWDNTFTIGVPDDHDDGIESVMLYYRYSEDNEEWSDWEQYGDNLTTSPFEWEFNANDGSGYYEFKTKAWDAHGVADESPVDSIRVTLFPTVLIILMIVLAILLMISTVFIRVKLKKKKV